MIILAAYPIWDMLFAIHPQGLLRLVPFMSPDALHLHSLVSRRVSMPIERRVKEMIRSRVNARVAPRIWLHTALCFALAIPFHDSTPALWLGIAGYAAFYRHQYRGLIRFRRQCEQAVGRRRTATKRNHAVGSLLRTRTRT